MLREALEVARRTLGPAHVNTLISCYDYGQLLLAQDKPHDAERELRGAVAIARDVLEGDDNTKLTLIDIEKAHVSGKLSEGEFAYASAPNRGGGDERCWKLKRWLYGMRPAARAWE